MAGIYHALLVVQNVVVSKRLKPDALHTPCTAEHATTPSQTASGYVFGDWGVKLCVAKCVSFAAR